MPVMLAEPIAHLTAAERALAVVGRFGDGEQSLPAALAAEADILVLQRGTLFHCPDNYHLAHHLYHYVAVQNLPLLSAYLETEGQKPVPSTFAVFWEVFQGHTHDGCGLGWRGAVSIRA